MSTINIRANVTVSPELLGEIIEAAFNDGFNSRDCVQDTTWAKLIKEPGNQNQVCSEMYECSETMRDEQLIQDRINASITVKSCFR